jgi:hypothetical protein
LDLAESLGELPSLLVHHCHHSTPNRRRPCHPGHDHAPDTTSVPCCPSSRAWREEVARSLLAHASPLSPPLASTPCRPEPPLTDRTPAGCRSAASVRELAGTCKRPKPPPTPSVGSTLPPPANAEAAPPLPSLLFALAHRAPPRDYKASTPPLPPFHFAGPLHHPPTHPLGQARASQLLSRAEKELCTSTDTEKKGGHGGRFRSKPSTIFDPLPLPCLAALTRRFSCDQEPLVELNGSSPEQQRYGNNVELAVTSRRQPDQAATTRSPSSTRPPKHITASPSDEP